MQICRRRESGALSCAGIEVVREEKIHEPLNRASYLRSENNGSAPLAIVAPFGAESAFFKNVVKCCTRERSDRKFLNRIGPISPTRPEFRLQPSRDLFDKTGASSR
jgi:hypothetical protein